ncbi:MAG: sensor histidine kinase, partial [Pseudomonadota bacterium]
MRSRGWLSLLGALVFATGGMVYQIAETTYRERALARLDDRAALFATTLTDTLERFHHLPAVLAKDPQIRAALTDDAAAANLRLEELATETGVEALYLMDRAGLTIAASNHRAE